MTCVENQRYLGLPKPLLLPCIRIIEPPAQSFPFSVPKGSYGLLCCVVSCCGTWPEAPHTAVKSSEFAIKTESTSHILDLYHQSSPQHTHSLELHTARHPGLLQKSHEVRVNRGLTYGCAQGLTTWYQYKLVDLVRTHLISFTQHGHTLKLLFCLCSEAFYYWSITLEREELFSPLHSCSLFCSQIQTYRAIASTC